MIKKDKINYKIDEEIVNNYVKAINSGKLKKQIKMLYWKTTYRFLVSFMLSHTLPSYNR